MLGEGRSEMSAETADAQASGQTSDQGNDDGDAACSRGDDQDGMGSDEGNVEVEGQSESDADTQRPSNSATAASDEGSDCEPSYIPVDERASRKRPASSRPAPSRKPQGQKADSGTSRESKTLSREERKIQALMKLFQKQVGLLHSRSRFGHQAHTVLLPSLGPQTL